MFERKMKAVCKEHMADKNEIKDNIIAQISTEPVKSTPKSYLKKALTTYAAFLITVVLVGGGIVVAAEAAEYNKAVSYLTEQGISIENMTRNEVKETYYKVVQDRAAYISSVTSNDISSDASSDASSDTSSDVSSDTSSNHPLENEGTKDSYVPPDYSSPEPSISTSDCQHESIYELTPCLEPTCITPGHTEVFACEDCGAIVLEGWVTPATNAHSFDSNDICIHCGMILNMSDYLTYELNEDGNGYTVTGFGDLPRDRSAEFCICPS